MTTPERKLAVQLELAGARHLVPSKAGIDFGQIIGTIAGLLKDHPELLSTVIQFVLGNPAIIALLLGLLNRPSSGSGDPTEAPAPPAPPAPSRVTRIVARVSNIMPPRRADDPSTPEDDRVPRAFFVNDSGQIVFTDGTDSLDDGSIVSVEMDVFDQYGNGMRIDFDPSATPAGQTNHPELLGKFVFVALSHDGTRMLGSIGPGYLDVGVIRHVEGPVHWLDPQPPSGPGAYRRSGGVWAECAVREKCAFRITEFTTGVRSNVIFSPEVR